MSVLSLVRKSVVSAPFAVLITLVSCTDKKPATSDSARSNEPKALFAAIASNDLAAVKSIVEAGANLESELGEPGSSLTPLVAATALGRAPIAEYLLERGASPYASFRGYRPRDFSIHTIGDTHRITRELRFVDGGF